jgi:hypothetical protein
MWRQTYLEKVASVVFSGSMRFLLRFLDEGRGSLSVICGWSAESSAHERVIKILTVASVAPEAIWVTFVVVFFIFIFVFFLVITIVSLLNIVWCKIVYSLVPYELELY